MRTLWLTTGLLLAASTAMAQAPDGKALYEKNCRMCHGVDGTPPAAMLKMMPTLPTLDAKFMGSKTEEAVIKVVTEGTPKMKSFKDKLKPEEIAAVAKYTRELAKKAEGPK